MSLPPLPPPPSVRVLLPSDPPQIEVLQEQLEDARRMVAVLTGEQMAALELHQPCRGTGGAGKCHRCHLCREPHPCRTARALGVGAE